MGGSCSSDDKGKSGSKTETLIILKDESDDREKTTITLKNTKKPCPTLASPDGSRIMTRRRLEDVIKI